MVLFTPRPLEDGDKNKSQSFISERAEISFSQPRNLRNICIWIYCILVTFIPIGIKLSVVTEDYLKV